MPPLDTHNHFLPGLDDGCRSLDESLAALRLMVDAGYTRLFVTPHAGDVGFSDPSVAEVAQHTDNLRAALADERIPIEIRPGGELRLSPDLPELARDSGIPTFGHAGKTVLFDLWEPDWPAWATRAVEWLLKHDYAPIMAHPERMPYLRQNPNKIADLAALGLRFQGNLGPIAGHDVPGIVELAHRYLQDGRYFMLGTDGHRPANLPQRLAGLQKAESLVGPDALRTLTETNPATLWL